MATRPVGMNALAWCAWCAWCAWGAGAAARELDPAACAARFDVQRDKIIRTEESREMGARYLSELDAGARAECLRLCCETDACDVFVFEEKSPGSCYLFACGPPEDFRCKFTAHGNFSSGVLAVSRRLAELQDRERLAQHERQLASLRSPPSSTPSSTPVASSAAPQPPPEPRVPPQPLAPPEPHAPPAPHVQPQPPPLLPTGRCSRYQFECRAGGECIAVYNACDGVPQCADGSDEAAELGCPPPGRAREPPAPPRDADDGADGEPWPHRLAQAQPQHRYDAVRAGGSHIFSHTGGLVQGGLAQGGLVQGGLAQGGLVQGGPAQSALDAWSPRAWAPPAGEAWAGAGRRAWPDEPRRAWPVPRPDPVRALPPAAAEELPLYVPSKTMPEMPMVYSSQQQALRDGPKKGFELMSQGPAPTPATPPPARPVDPAPVKPALGNTSKKKALDDFIESPQPVGGRWTPTQAEREPAPGLEAHAWPLSERGGLSDHPPAAVLLLVLGTLLTAALGALLACRARAARRRRRAHPRLALDADYLVNGMYL